MLLPGTYANGFAPRDGTPLYPELWKGCVGAWNPGLGVSGLTLRDQSGFQNNGTLTNGPTWAASQGKYAMSFDGVDDYVKCSNVSVGNLGTKNATIVVWCVLQNSNLFGNIIAKRNNGGVFQQWALFQGYLNSSFAAVTGKMIGLFWYAGGSITSSQHIYTTADIADDKPHCIVASRISGTTPTIWVDGVKRATTTIGTDTSNVNADSSADPIRIGSGSDSGGYLSYTNMENRIYDRALSPQEIRLLSTRRGIAYEMAPRRRSSVQVTTNRLRRALIGS